MTPLRSIPLLILLSALCLPLRSGAQKLDVPPDLPLSRQRITVLGFESPDDTTLGEVIARRFAFDLHKRLKSCDRVHLFYPRKAAERFSVNPDMPASVATQQEASFAVWGEYYIEGENVIIRPYMQIVYQIPISEEFFGLKLATEDGIMLATAPTAQMNFNPIRVPLTTLRAGLKGPLTISTLPRRDSTFIATAAPGESFSILELNKSWSRIRTATGLSGWVEADSQTVAFPTSSVITCCDAIAQFMAGDYAQFETKSVAYLAGDGKSDEEMNRAFLHLLLGTARLRQLPPGAPVPRDEKVADEYKKARTLLPGNPSPIEHLAILRLLMHSAGSTGPVAGTIPELAESEDELIAALQSDKNQQTSDNLKIFYRQAERKKFLKDPAVDEKTYGEQVRQRIGIVQEVDEEEKRLRETGTRTVYIERTLMVESHRTDMISLNGGIWRPADIDKGFTYGNVVYDNPNTSLRQSRVVGGEINVRNQMKIPLFVDFSFSGWYTSYNYEQTTGIVESGLVSKATAWLVTLPMHIGLAWTPFPLFQIQPYVNAGAGAAAGFSSMDVTINGVQKTEETKLQFAFSWYAGGGLDIFLTHTFGLSASVKMQSLKFKDPFYTGQKEMTGLQLFAGMTWKM